MSLTKEKPREFLKPHAMSLSGWINPKSHAREWLGFCTNGIYAASPLTKPTCITPYQTHPLISPRTFPFHRYYVVGVWSPIRVFLGDFLLIYPWLLKNVGGFVSSEFFNIGGVVVHYRVSNDPTHSYRGSLSRSSCAKYIGWNDFEISFQEKKNSKVHDHRWFFLYLKWSSAIVSTMISL